MRLWLSSITTRRCLGMSDSCDCTWEIESTPALLEPGAELLRRVLVQDVYVELALVAKAREGQVGAAHETDHRHVDVVLVAEVELRMEWGPQVEFHHHLARQELAPQPP